MNRPPCEHDWRVNPHLILASNPPRQQIRCVKCGALSSRQAGSQYVDANTPVESWPKA